VQKIKRWDPGALFGPIEIYVAEWLRFASFHEDVDVVAGL